MRRKESEWDIKKPHLWVDIAIHSAREKQSEVVRWVLSELKMKSLKLGKMEQWCYTAVVKSKVPTLSPVVIFKKRQPRL